MTKIHPEAVALLNKHRGTTFRPGGEHYVENLTATEAISQALFERDALKDAADAVYNRLMPEVETLRAQVAEMRLALKRLVRLNEDYSPFGGELFQDRVDRAWDKAKAILIKDKPND